MQIKTEDLTADDIGREVRYNAWPNCPNDAVEFGVITSYNETTVFVRYGGDKYPKATTPSDLEFTL